jgi:hypothetical protein
MPTDLAVKLSGLFLGVIARTLLPWLRKVREGKVRRFDRRYLLSALASLAIGLILTLVLFPRFEAGADGRTFEALFKLFALAFAFGFGWNALVNEGGAWAAEPDAQAPAAAPGGPRKAA